MATANDVFEHHLAAFAAGDIDEIVKDYAPNSVMLYGERIWHGLDGARAFFQLWIDDWIPPGSRFDVIDRQATADVVYLTWTAESDNYVFEFGTDTFVIKDAKVLHQTVATHHRRK